MKLSDERQREILLSEMKHLAETVHRRFYSHVPQWRSLDDPRGILSQLDNMIAGILMRVEELEGAISWISPPFVDESTPCEELRRRVGFVVKDAAQGIEAAPAAETVELGSVQESPVGNADAPKED